MIYFYHQITTSAITGSSRVQIYVTRLGALAYSVLRFRLLSEVICTYTLFLGQSFIMYVFYIFIFV